MKKILGWVDANIGELVSDLQSLIQQPSISAKNEGIEDCAKLVTKILKQSGIKPQILRLKKGIAPVVFAVVNSKKIQQKHSYSIIIMTFNQLNQLNYGLINHFLEKLKATKFLVVVRLMIKEN